MFSLYCSYCNADTIMTAPDGKQLCYGISEVFCKLDPDNPNITYQCLLLGSYKGTSVVAPESQRNPAIANKLYMVRLIDSKTADYGFLKQNIIQIQGASLFNYVRFNQTSQISWSSGQLCQWTDKDTKADYLLMTNQYSQGFGVFQIVPPDQSKGELSYTANFLKTVTLPGSATIVTDLDVIDLNAYSKHTNLAVVLPRALMVWRKGNNQTGYDNLQITDPTQLYICTFEGLNLNVTQNINMPYSPNSSGFFNKGQQGYHTDTDFSWTNMMHGFMVMPDSSGELTYVCATSDGRAQSFRYCYVTVTDYSEADYNYWAYALPVQIDKQNRIMLTGGISPDYRTFGYSYVTKTSHYEDIPTLYKQANISTPGLSVLVTSSSDVGLYPVAPTYALNHTTTNLQKNIGKINYLTPDQLSSISFTGVSPDFGPSPTDQQKIESYLVSQGVQIYCVLYSWPYFAWPKSQALANFPSYTQTDAHSNLQATEVGNGVSVDSEEGVQGKANIDIVQVSASVGIKTNFDYMKTHGKTQSSSLSTASTIEKKDMSDTDYVKDGIVFYTEVNPAVISYGWIDPYNGPVHVNGVTAEQFAEVIMAAGVAPSTGLMISQFDVTNPSQLLVPQWTNVVPDNTYSALSDGLTAKPSGSLLAWDKPGDINSMSENIRNWQSQNGIEDLIARAKADHTTKAGWGVAPYYKSDNGINYNLATATEVDGSSAITNTDAVTESFGVGVTWSFKVGIAGSGMYDKGSIMYKHSSNFTNSDTTSSGFSIKIPSDNLIPSTNYQIWVLYINVPMLKTALADSNGNVQKPPYVPAWCWKYDQSFMLIVPYVPEKYNMTDFGS